MTVIVYRMYPFVHRFANGQESQRIRRVILNWAEQHSIALEVEVIQYAVYVGFPTEESLTLYCLTISDIDHNFQRVDRIPE
jgi:hypothetical protein